ncbi:MAG: NAD-dependent epimerase/dehydratase family protein [Acidimicrobiales bacterium]
MTVVALTGAGTPLGRLTRQLLEAESPDPVEVRALAHPSSGDVAALADLKRQTEGAAVLLHLASSRPSTPTGGTADVEVARWVLEAASSASVDHVVVLSDATVYGAWANNPVPLTEDAVLRPNPGFTWAVERAEIERLAGEWRAAHPQATLGILRPVRTAGRHDWLVRALRPAPAVPELADDPPAQFLNLDDLAAAVALACRARLDGVFNVAPDDAVPGDEVRSLTGAGPKVRLPERLAARYARWRFRSGLGLTPPELVPYTLFPWVVANDRLRAAAGWRAEVTNEEACVEAHEAGPWATLSPRRRQEIALGVAGAGLVAGLAGGALAVRRWLLPRVRG